MTQRAGAHIKKTMPVQLQSLSGRVSENLQTHAKYVVAHLDLNLKEQSAPLELGKPRLAGFHN